MLQSVPQMPVYFTLMSTSSSPISGTGTSFTLRVSIFSRTAAFIIFAMEFTPGSGMMLVEEHVVPALVGLFDQQRFEECNGLGDAVVAAHRHILVLIGHHVVVADQGQLRDDLLPRYRAPTRDAEAEAAAEALPVALRDHAGAAHVVRYELAILGVHVEDAPGERIDEVLHVDAEVDQVGRVEVEAELLATAHQLHRAHGGLDVVDQLVGVGLMRK